ncbi:glycosyltransferase family 2 protein [Legionella parisiensis]|uniref:Putative glycosyltransferase n=2 Tax=Legionella parisiensis TaxID=45071 RepID=A0A1E5JLR2_9GAMM|nr:glycosyltransferase family 2 protein [Legionella parisiensis]OEH45273.1 putative glycosyltransferase [Legionella parisiensis]STX76003.1 glycosyltransferase [Legionella parisiensis]
MKQENNLPKISIVTPSFNQGPFLRQCIESVLSQNYPNLEYIVIDGGSHDDSLSIIHEFEPHFAYWVSEPDKGQSEAINKGFRKASGELVAWLNSDDYYLPGTFEHVIKAYQINPHAPFYFGDGYRVSKTGEVLTHFFPKNSLTFDRHALVMGLNYILQPSTFMNRNCLEQIGYLNTELEYGMDFDLWIRLSTLGDPHPIHGVLSANREYNTTKTSTGSFKRIEELRRISLQHSGLEMTPGILRYMFDTLYKFAKTNENIFPGWYQKDVMKLWKRTGRLMAQFDANKDGFPRRSSLASFLKNKIK